MNAEQLERLSQYGLFHATTETVAELIKANGLKPSDKPLFRREKNMVWLYPNNPTKNHANISQVLNKGKRKNYTHVVVFTNFTDEIIEKLRSRSWDDAIIHDGLLNVGKENAYVISIDEFLKKS